VDALRAEGAARVEANLERSHTNPAQFDASYGLTTAGAVAVPALMALLKDEAWWLRSSAADILGDMGRDATDATSALAATLSDSSEWVRRNAAEALGIIGSAAAQVGTAQLAGPSASQSGSPAGDTQAGDTQPGDALAACLQDESVAVRHNAALALARMGGGPQEALRAATRDESIYVSELSKIALERS
jgi:HEAT repeat protein